jgi:hypothetical protein
MIVSEKTIRLNSPIRLHSRFDSTLDNYIESWKAHASSVTAYIFDNSLPVPPEFTRYLRDWHCVADQPSRPLYAPHPALTDDWVNQYFDYTVVAELSDGPVADTLSEDAAAPGTPAPLRGADYRFVYLGPHSSWTPLHRDVFASHSWSTNVCGAKLWLFLSPGTRGLTDVEGAPCCGAYDAYDAAGLARDGFGELGAVMARALAEAEAAVGRHWAQRGAAEAADGDDANSLCLNKPPFSSRVRVLLQLPGDAVFVPSGWTHQVVNLSDCVSVNHNWVPCEAAARCADQLHTDLAAVDQSIRGWGMDGDEDAEVEQFALSAAQASFSAPTDVPAPPLAVLERLGQRQAALRAQSGTTHARWVQLATLAALYALARAACLVDWGHAVAAAEAGAADAEASTPLSSLLPRLHQHLHTAITGLPPRLRRILADLASHPALGVSPRWSSHDQAPLRREILTLATDAVGGDRAVHSHADTSLPPVSLPEAHPARYSAYAFADSAYSGVSRAEWTAQAVPRLRHCADTLAAARETVASLSQAGVGAVWRWAEAEVPGGPLRADADALRQAWRRSGGAAPASEACAESASVWTDIALGNALLDDLHARIPLLTAGDWMDAAAEAVCAVHREVSG